LLETLETILDRAQAGEPVWDWDQESVIDELLGVDEPLAVPSGAVSVVELDKPAPPVRLVAQQPERPASPPPVPVDDVAIVVELPPEETISIEDLAAELSDEDIAPLELPVETAAIEEPLADLDVKAVDTAMVVEDFDPNAVMVETEAAKVSVDDAGADESLEALEAADEMPAAVEDAPAKANGKSGARSAKASAAAEVDKPDPAEGEPEPADVEPAPANSLEALMRRRGLSAVAHVEEVEVTGRG